jgi:hypothetical protein
MPIHDWTRVDAGIFHDFYLDWIFTIKRALNDGVLPAGYYALAEQIAGGLHPDVLTLERAPPPSPSAPERYAQKRSRLAIRHVSGDQVVAVLEIVSPGNKASRPALRALVDKAVEFLHAGVHLLIIDLFPPGPRDPQGIHKAIWSEILDDDFRLPADKPLTLVAYAAGLVKRAYIEPVAVGDVLPDMPVFLEPDIYVLVPLESTYQAAFDAVPRRWREELEKAEGP